MKSAHNRLVDGKGNLYLCVKRSKDDGKKEFYLPRYGHAFDSSLNSKDVNKFDCPLGRGERRPRVLLAT